MKYSKFHTIAAAGVMLTGVLLAAGQAFSQDHRQRARVRENILTLRLVRMTQALELTREQTAEIYPELHRLEKEKAALQAALTEHIVALRTALRSPGASEADLERITSAVRDLRTDIRRKDEEFEAFLDARLDPAQKAKYLLFTIDFFRGLGEQMNRARSTAPRVKRKSML